jgi:penicillin-binding protein 1A
MLPDGSRLDRNRVRTEPVLPPGVAATETSMLETVLQYGTGRAAAIGQFAAGKTGTTSNYGDAWFVGWDSKYTVAVWVGYPNKLIPMTTDFDNGPVLGGTFPALIWHDFMTSALQIDKTRAEQASAGKNAAGKGGGPSTTITPEASSPSPAGATGQGTTPTSAGKGNAKPSTPSGGGKEAGSATPEHIAAPPTATPTPASEPPSAPSSTPSTPAASSPAAPSSPAQTGGVSPGG